MLLMWPYYVKASEKVENSNKYFQIKIVDDQTGRGVPMVEIRIVNNLRYYSDSNGIVAFYEPGLMNIETFFHVKSHGYEYPADGFGYRGTILTPESGESVTLSIKRINIAERLYRITGEGIYNDSILTGKPVPLKNPLLCGKVMGQDSVLHEKYRGKIFWIWGDTGKPSYPLGNFSSSGAVSELPGKGGLDPAKGVNLQYFVNENGFSKKMAPFDEPGMIWLEALISVKDDDDNEKLVAVFNRMKSLGEKYERGFVIFNDNKEIFEKVKTFDKNRITAPSGHPLRRNLGNEEMLYFSSPFHPGVNLRVRANFKDVVNLDAYEILIPPVTSEKKNNVSKAAWKKISELPGDEIEKQEKIRARWESSVLNRYAFDIETGEKINPHGGSIYWNDYRQKWIMLFLQIYGKSSLLGEVWYMEADTPTGPWAYARKIVTHDDYSFYNVKQNPYFDQENGRLIYFEGTYTQAFSDAKFGTPRYDYNQIMYRLSLDDKRLHLPVSVYSVRNGNNKNVFVTGDQVEIQNKWGDVESVPFFACAPGRPMKGTIPVYVSPEENGRLILQSLTGKEQAPPLFHALGVDDASSHTLPLYEYRNSRSGSYYYKTDENLAGEALKRSENPLCRVWKNPLDMIILDHQ
mgnify:CR=1 FL=1